MANYSTYIQYHYDIELIYLNKKGTGTKKNITIRRECIKMMAIDYDFDAEDCMPVVFVSLNLDKSLIDYMIQHANDNLFILAVYKFDNLSSTKEKIECFREKFTYAMNNDINKNDAIDYNESTQEEHGENTYKNVVIGLMCVKHINRNRYFPKLKVVKKNTMYEIVRNTLSKYSNLVIENFSDNKKFESLIVPDEDSVNKQLKALNDIRVFYKTPYRFFNDFDATYLVSSSGKGIRRSNEKYCNLLIQIKDIISDEANDVGFIINHSKGAYQIPVSYADTQIYDNTVANKSATIISGKTSAGYTSANLNNKSSYTDKITSTVRLNNENDGMLDNIKADKDNNNFFIFFSKADLDFSLFTLNKKITVKNIDRYADKDGKYLLFRKRSLFILEDDRFRLVESINLRKIGK